ncbi:MAG: tRNA pseudouridine(55) synthase TruB [Chloroflexota bacterium]
MITGILPVDKPLGWTSHDVVARVRRLAGQRQVGHAGTLDPLASGVLVLVLGEATRVSSYLMATSKVYCAEVVLGATTATDDAEGELRDRASVDHITPDALEAAVQGFCGTIMQTPPAYAAVRQGGQKLYVLARKGIAVDPEPRQVTVHAIDVIEWSTPRLRLRVHCGSGTYIRALARDIGQVLGVGGYLHALQRARSGQIAVEHCVSMEKLTERRDVGMGVLPIDYAVADWPALILRNDERDAIRVGRPIRVPALPAGDIRLYARNGMLVALARAHHGLVKPFKVFGEREPVHAHRS